MKWEINDSEMPGQARHDKDARSGAAIVAKGVTPDLIRSLNETEGQMVLRCGVKQGMTIVY